jgi:hypothetical protein
MVKLLFISSIFIMNMQIALAEVVCRIDQNLETLVNFKLNDKNNYTALVSIKQDIKLNDLSLHIYTTLNKKGTQVFNVMAFNQSLDKKVKVFYGIEKSDELIKTHLRNKFNSEMLFVRNLEFPASDDPMNLSLITSQTTSIHEVSSFKYELICRPL